MPRFYFHANNGHAVRDEDGSELASLDLAKSEAYRVVAEMISLHQQQMMQGETLTVTLCDAGQAKLLTVQVVSTLHLTQT